MLSRQTDRQTDLGPCAIRAITDKRPLLVSTCLDLSLFSHLVFFLSSRLFYLVYRLFSPPCPCPLSCLVCPRRRRDRAEILFFPFFLPFSSRSVSAPADRQTGEKDPHSFGTCQLTSPGDAHRIRDGFDNAMRGSWWWSVCYYAYVCYYGPGE